MVCGFMRSGDRGIAVPLNRAPVELRQQPELRERRGTAWVAVQVDCEAVGNLAPRASQVSCRNDAVQVDG